MRPAVYWIYFADVSGVCLVNYREKYQERKYEMRTFFFKKHVKFAGIIKNGLFKVHSIACYTFFPSSGQFLNAGKNVPLLLRTIRRAIFSHLRTNRSAAQQVRDPSVQTSGNRKEPSLASKAQRVEFLS